MNAYSLIMTIVIAFSCKAAEVKKLTASTDSDRVQHPLEIRITPPDEPPLIPFEAFNLPSPTQTHSSDSDSLQTSPSSLHANIAQRGGRTTTRGRGTNNQQGRRRPQRIEQYNPNTQQRQQNNQEPCCTRQVIGATALVGTIITVLTLLLIFQPPR